MSRENGPLGLLSRKRCGKPIPNQRCREHYEKTWTTQKSGPVVVAFCNSWKELPDITQFRFFGRVSRRETNPRHFAETWQALRIAWNLLCFERGFSRPHDETNPIRPAKCVVTKRTHGILRRRGEDCGRIGPVPQPQRGRDETNPFPAHGDETNPRGSGERRKAMPTAREVEEKAGFRRRPNSEPRGSRSLGLILVPLNERERGGYNHGYWPTLPDPP